MLTVTESVGPAPDLSPKFHIHINIEQFPGICIWELLRPCANTACPKLTPSAPSCSGSSPCLLPVFHQHRHLFHLIGHVGGTGTLPVVQARNESFSLPFTLWPSQSSHSVTSISGAPESSLLPPVCLNPGAGLPNYCSNRLTGLPGFVVILEQSFQHIVMAIVILLKCSHVISMLQTPSGFPFSEHSLISMDKTLPDQALFASWALALSPIPLRLQRHGMPFIIHNAQCSLLPLLLSRVCS